MTECEWIRVWGMKQVKIAIEGEKEDKRATEQPYSMANYLTIKIIL